MTASTQDYRLLQKPQKTSRAALRSLVSTSRPQPGLTSSFTVHVVPEVHSQRREEGDEVDDEESLFPAVGLAILEDGLFDHSVACWVYVGGFPS